MVVVEHDEEIMRAADHLIDVGPDAGRLGGEIVFDGDAKDVNAKSLKQYPNSYTVKYLLHKEKIPVPARSLCQHPEGPGTALSKSKVRA